MKNNSKGRLKMSCSCEKKYLTIKAKENTIYIIEKTAWKPFLMNNSFNPEVFFRCNRTVTNKHTKFKGVVRLSTNLLAN